VTAVQVEPVTQPSEWQKRFQSFTREQLELLDKRGETSTA
jgi:formate dehydrogenase major subunit